MKDDYQDIFEAGKKEPRQLLAGLTWGEAMCIAWFQIWRQTVAALGAGFLLGQWKEFFTEAPWVPMLALLVYCYLIVAPFVTAQIFRKRFKGFRVAIVRD